VKTGLTQHADAADFSNKDWQSARPVAIFWPLQGVRMRFALLIAGLALATQAAVAQTSNCQSITNQMDRLACYDKASPTPSAATPPKKTDTHSKKAEKSAAPKAQPEQGQIVDMLAAENKKLDAKLKTICRGC
jgi:hypothetical protein